MSLARTILLTLSRSEGLRRVAVGFGPARAMARRFVAAEGYRVRAYVPYGEQWYPYFMRRLAERPANLLFLLRNLFRA
jgi:proline dehydrogenase